MKKTEKFSPEVIERAVRLVFKAKDQYESQCAGRIELLHCDSPWRFGPRGDAGDAARWPGCAGPRAEGVIDIERSALNLIKSIYVTAGREGSVSVIKMVSNNPVLGLGFLHRGD